MQIFLIKNTTKIFLDIGEINFLQKYNRQHRKRRTIFIARWSFNANAHARLIIVESLQMTD